MLRSPTVATTPAGTSPPSTTSRPSPLLMESRWTCCSSILWISLVRGFFYHFLVAFIGCHPYTDFYNTTLYTTSHSILFFSQAQQVASLPRATRTTSTHSLTAPAAPPRSSGAGSRPSCRPALLSTCWSADTTRCKCLMVCLYGVDIQ